MMLVKEKGALIGVLSFHAVAKAALRAVNFENKLRPEANKASKCPHTCRKLGRGQKTVSLNHSVA